ncbi:MAG: YibE/F family protein [Firmicutes bacterium]|nr:YibE/F family protein [Bacillota bacterium]
MLRITYSNSLMEMINTESIVVELLNAIVGSLGILLTMPLTALVCVVMYRGTHARH